MTFKVIWVKKVKVGKNGLVRVITFEGLKLGSPNLDIKCIMGRSRMGLYMVEFDLGLQGHLGAIKVKIGKKMGFYAQ